MYEMVNNIKTNFQTDLTLKIYKSKDFKIAEYLVESSEIMNELIKSKNRFKDSEKALKLTRKIEQYCYMIE